MVIVQDLLEFYFIAYNKLLSFSFSLWLLGNEFASNHEHKSIRTC